MASYDEMAQADLSYDDFASTSDKEPYETVFDLMNQQADLDLSVQGLEDAAAQLEKTGVGLDTYVEQFEYVYALGQEKGWKQPTVLTFLSRLVEKGLLETEKRGKLRSYTAAMTREAYKNSETRDFLAQLYGGSVQNLVACMADGGGIPPEELETLRVWLKEREPQ